MKVGTDGVLLGAWANPSTIPQRILDIGTGTGLIAIMLAQRFQEAKITAIDIDSDAIKEATLNMKSSPWSNRLECQKTPLQSANFSDVFDLIVCNPPYFENTTKSDDEKRTKARHTDTLTLIDIFEKMPRLLSENGELMIVYPSESVSNIQMDLKAFGLYLNEICWVRGNENSKVKRALLKISKQKKELNEGFLTIEKERHKYTDEYLKLCKDFYLNL